MLRMRSPGKRSAASWLRMAGLLPLLGAVGVASAFFASGFEISEAAVCAQFYAAGFTPVTGTTGAAAATKPASTRPPKGEAFADTRFGTCVVRATAHASEPPSGFARNDYSRRQAFNADRSRFIVYSLNGFWHLYDARNLAFLRTLNGLAGDAEPQWHPSNPRWLYYVPREGGRVLYRLDVETNQTTTVANFAGRLPWSGVQRIWTKSEGSPSADGRYWCFQAETADFAIRGVFTYDLQTDTILGTRSMNSRPDHLSMSASGRWCVVSSDGNDGTVAWNRTFTESRQLHHKSEHSDIGLGVDGNDKFIFVDYQNDGMLQVVDIDTGARTNLFSTYIDRTATAYHVSAKSFSRPGWFLLSTYARYSNDGVDRELWLHDRIMAVEMAADPRILHVAHHHSRENGYFTEPHASVSRDFRNLLFSSNWEVNSDQDIDAYMVVLPADFLPAPR